MARGVSHRRCRLRGGEHRERHVTRRHNVGGRRAHREVQRRVDVGGGAVPHRDRVSVSGKPARHLRAHDSHPEEADAYGLWHDFVL